jgi:hypothetical protein
MMDKIYLYVDTKEDQTRRITWSSAPPNDADWEKINKGILTVVTIGASLTLTVEDQTWPGEDGEHCRSGVNPHIFYTINGGYLGKEGGEGEEGK